jgi:hypothetical protein
MKQTFRRSHLRKGKFLMISRRSLLFVLSAFGLAGGPAAAQNAWKTYRNDRFGTTIEYPSDRFRALRPPDNGDGLKFVASDGATFTVSAGRNVLEQSLAEIERDMRADDAKRTISYRSAGPDWFVLSGSRGNMTFYERHLLSHQNQIRNSFVMSYPKRLDTAYDTIVTRMSRSFKAGPGSDSGRP